MLMLLIRHDVSRLARYFRRFQMLTPLLHATRDDVYAIAAAVTRYILRAADTCRAAARATMLRLPRDIRYAPRLLPILLFLPPLRD